jgi:hypothetical protein
MRLLQYQEPKELETRIDSTLGGSEVKSLEKWCSGARGYIRFKKTFKKRGEADMNYIRIWLQVVA